MNDDDRLPLLMKQIVAERALPDLAVRITESELDATVGAFVDFHQRRNGVIEAAAAGMGRVG